MRSLIAVHAVAFFARAAAQDPELEIADPAVASAVVGGMAEGFMGKKDLPKIEHDCIVKGVQTMSKEVMSVALRSVSLLQDILGKKPPDQQYADPYAQGDPQGFAAPVGGSANLIMQIRSSVTKLMSLEMELTNDCVRGDALSELDLAARHMQNLSFVGNHLLANGADIAVEITQAIEAFQHKNYHQFGRTLGTTWRKVLLENPHGMPGGPPSRYALQQMTAGIVQGYFGEGFSLTVSNQSPLLQKPLVLNIDLHKCIGGNVPFFQSIFASLWLFMQQISLAGPKKKKIEKGAWEAALAQGFLLMPAALTRCGITSAQEAMLQDSVTALSAFQFALDFPKSDMGGAEMSVVLSSTIRDWTKSKWHAFGIDLGKLLQQMVLLTYPQEYSLDSSSMLKKELRAVRGSWATPLLMVCGVAALITAAVVPRVARRFKAREYSRPVCDEEEMARQGMRDNSQNLLEEGEEAPDAVLE